MNTQPLPVAASDNPRGRHARPNRLRFTRDTLSVVFFAAGLAAMVMAFAFIMEVALLSGNIGLSDSDKAKVVLVVIGLGLLGFITTGASVIVMCSDQPPLAAIAISLAGFVGLAILALASWHMLYLMGSWMTPFFLGYDRAAIWAIANTCGINC